jgi:hypothetical protein
MLLLMACKIREHPKLSLFMALPTKLGQVSPVEAVQQALEHQ